MKRYIVLIGNEVSFLRHESADTLTGIKRRQTKAHNDGCCTELLDTAIQTEDDLGQLHYAEIDRDGNQVGWRNARALNAE